MKNSKLLVVLFLFIGLTSSGCFFDIDDDDGGFFNCIEGEGGTVTRTLNVDDFTGIDLSCSAKVFIKQGNDQLVEVEGQDNIIDELETDVNSGNLDLELQGCFTDYDELKIYITLPELDYLRVSGSGEINGQGLIQTNDIVLRVTGSGDIEMELEADDIDAKISGSGKMSLDGVANDLDLKITGSGDLRGFDLELEKADIEINGSGDVRTRVSDILDVKISGSGDVFYKGYPSLNVDITGSGSVIDAN